MNALKLAVMILVHPKDAFPLIKMDRDRFSYIPALVLLVMLMATRVACIYIVHYPLALLQPRDTNFLLEVVKMLVPLLTWVVSCYSITTISSGECLMREVFMAASYAMLPYIVMMIPIALLSRILTGYEAVLYYGLQTFVWVWVVLLFLISIHSMNDYTVKETLGIFFLSIIGIVLIWVLIGLFYSLSKHLLSFIVSIVREIQFIFMH